MNGETENILADLEKNKRELTKIRLQAPPFRAGVKGGTGSHEK